MKKIIYGALMLVVSSLVFTSCKKGENDPGLSLKSRKARIVGEWNVTGYEETNIQTNGTKEVYSLSGTSMNYTTTPVSGSGLNFSYNYSQKITFNKDYTFEIIIDEIDTKTTQTGNWAWTGKSKAGEVKKKEGVVLSVSKTVNLDAGSPDGTSESTEFSNNAITMYIDMLKSKDIVFKSYSKYTETESGQAAEVYSNESTITAKKQ